MPRSTLTDKQHRADDLSLYKICDAGDIVINRMSAYQGALGISPAAGLVSPEYLVLRTHEDVDARYLTYLIKSDWFVGQMSARVRGIGSLEQGNVRTPRINADDLGGIEVTLPHLDEQRRIATFLDAETARIDRLMRMRDQQVEHEDAWVLAVIAEELSGRRSSRPKQSTELPWMPTIPDYWRLGPVYAYFDVRLGKMLSPERASGDHPRPYLRNANVHWFDLSVEDLAVMSFEPHERRRYRLEPGDLVVCEGGAGVAEAAVWRGEVDECYYQKSLHRVRATAHLPVE